MSKVLRLFTSKEFLKFIVTGGFAAAVNFFSRIWINHSLSFSVSVVLAYILGMITAFILSKLFVFQTQKTSTTRQFMIFTIVNIVAVFQTLIISVVFKDYVFPIFQWSYHPEEFAHLIGISIPIFSSYLGHKYFTFSKAGKVQGS